MRVRVLFYIGLATFNPEMIMFGGVEVTRNLYYFLRGAKAFMLHVMDLFQKWGGEGLAPRCRFRSMGVGRNKVSFG